MASPTWVPTPSSGEAHTERAEGAESRGPDLADLLRWQAETCRTNGSPLYARILTGVVADLEAGEGPWVDLLAPHAADPVGSALPLRLLGGVHRLVLEGRAPALAAFYPSAGGRPDAGDPWPAFRQTVLDHAGEVGRRLLEPVQTNEVGRSVALAGGFLLVVKRCGLPLRLLEVGASAGLNLRWDQYRYEARGRWWGPEGSPLVFADAFEGRPPFDQTAVVAGRRGCDPNPLDPADPADRLTLRSFVWPDRLERLLRLDAAIAIAARVPATVDRADAVDWLPERLAEATPGVATVVFHSIVLQYLPKAGRQRVRAAIEEAGARATPDAPLAWLRMEPGRRRNRADVLLRLWPDGRDALIAYSAFHGPAVSWVG